MQFDWDSANTEHLARHEISTSEAEQVAQNDPIEINGEFLDDEDRFTLIGETNARRILVIVVTLRDGAVRVITGWSPTAASKRQYLQERSSSWH